MTDNNELTAFVTVLDGGIRVLYIDGNLGWQERKFVRRSLDESPDIQVDLWLDTRRQMDSPLALPLDSGNLYDVFILGDVDALALGTENCLKLATAVGDGAGLMLLGGKFTYGPGGYAGTPLEPVLPIQIDRLERQMAGEPLRQDVHLAGKLPMLPTTDHFATRLDLATRNVEHWQRLPPLLGANRFRSLGPQARVLAKTPNDDPLLVEGKFGTGRVLAFAGDSTYRWYRYGFQDDHRRFWRQSILWLAHKDESDQNDVWIRLPQRRFRRGARVPLTVGVRDSTGTTIEDAEIRVQLNGPEGMTESIRVTRREEQWTGRSQTLAQPGDYTLSVTALRDGQEIGSTSGDFLVLDQDLEMTDPSASPGYLENLARLTEDAGGTLIAAEQLSETLEKIKTELIDSEAEFQSKWQLTDTVWDASFLFIGLFGLLTVEWYLRKSWGLV